MGVQRGIQWRNSPDRKSLNFRQPCWDSFTRVADLEELVLALDRQYNHIVPEGSTLSDAALSIIKAAEAGPADRRWTADLLSAAAAERPALVHLQDTIRKLHIRVAAPEEEDFFYGGEASGLTQAQAEEIEAQYRGQLVRDLRMHDFRGIVADALDIRLPLADIYLELGLLRRAARRTTAADRRRCWCWRNRSGPSRRSGDSKTASRRLPAVRRDSSSWASRAAARASRYATSP